jgi:hypothetical protein
LKNKEQIIKIYNFYANSTESCKIGTGKVKQMMNFDSSLKFLKDFEVMPTFVDISTFQNIYRTCKLWEWRQCYMILDQDKQFSQEEADISFSFGCFSLTLSGLFELLSRVACGTNQIDENLPGALKQMLKIMAISKGKNILAEASRGSIVIKPFNSSE